MYTIFINDSEIYLTEKPIKKAYFNTFFYDDYNLNQLINTIEKRELKKVCIYNNDLDILWDEFKNQFKIIEAAGGVVFNKKNETLWIFRNDVWDLPKGKIEVDESAEFAALREVEEECGVTNLKILGLIDKTYHIYTFKNKRILKITYWYKMIANSQQDLIPQLEEGITKVEWIENVKLKEVLKNTYGNIKIICKFAFSKKVG